jgi:hypothetical protein
VEAAHNRPQSDCGSRFDSVQKQSFAKVADAFPEFAQAF